MLIPGHWDASPNVSIGPLRSPVPLTAGSDRPRCTKRREQKLFKRDGRRLKGHAQSGFWSFVPRPATPSNADREPLSQLVVKAATAEVHAELQNGDIRGRIHTRSGSQVPRKPMPCRAGSSCALRTASHRSRDRVSWCRISELVDLARAGDVVIHRRRVAGDQRRAPRQPLAGDHQSPHGRQPAPTRPCSIPHIRIDDAEGRAGRRGNHCIGSVRRSSSTPSASSQRAPSSQPPPAPRAPQGRASAAVDWGSDVRRGDGFLCFRRDGLIVGHPLRGARHLLPFRAPTRFDGCRFLTRSRMTSS